MRGNSVQTPNGWFSWLTHPFHREQDRPMRVQVQGLHRDRNGVLVRVETSHDASEAADEAVYEMLHRHD